MMKMESLKHFKELSIHTMTVRDYVSMKSYLDQKGIRYWSDKNDGWKISDIRDNCLIEENMSIDFDRYDKKESIANHFVPIQYRHDYYEEDRYTVKNIVAFIEEFSVKAAEKRIGNFKNMQNDYSKGRWSKMSLVNRKIIGGFDYENEEEY